MIIPITTAFINITASGAWLALGELSTRPCVNKNEKGKVDSQSQAQASLIARVRRQRRLVGNAVMMRASELKDVSGISSLIPLAT